MKSTNNHEATPATKQRNKQRGVVLSEFVLLLPLLLATMMGVFDLGRLVYAHQIMTDMTRESANLVSRGASKTSAYNSSVVTDGPIQLAAHGGMLISTVQRRNFDDPTPWVIDQDGKGPLGNVASRIGKPGGPAEIPNLDKIAPGVTLMVVETVHSFEPVFGMVQLGLNFYPDMLYDVAFF